MNSRTIAAISTPQGNGGIALIRISGDDAIKIADKIFYGTAPLENAKSHTLHYGFIKNDKGEKVDEVLLSLMRAPRTFTKEDVVEISTHGGARASHAVLSEVIKAGAYHAEAGEFTKRAFLNGRIDLAQAEAVIDIINAENDMSRKNALAQLEGSLSQQIHQIREKLLYLSAQMQVKIDYPDEDLEDITDDDMLSILEECKNDVATLLETSDSGKIIKDGIRTAIVGKPNAGKSSLLNLLSGTDRAIVTEIAGTTRDVIEENITLSGIPLTLIDTAGIHETDDVVEKIGVERSIKSISDADLVIAVLDAESGITKEDIDVLKKTENTTRIILINKTDVSSFDFEKELALCKCEAIIETSVKTSLGIDKLQDTIKKIYNLDKITFSKGAIITNMRHISALRDAKNSLKNALASLNCGMPQDIVSIDILGATSALGEIIGQTVSDDIVDKIFHNFCVGK